MTTQAIGTKAFDGDSQHPKQSERVASQRRESFFIQRLHDSHCFHEHRLTLRFVERSKVGALAAKPEQFGHDLAVSSRVLTHIEPREIQTKHAGQIEPALSLHRQSRLTVTSLQSDDHRLDVVFEFLAVLIRTFEHRFSHHRTSRLPQSPFDELDPAAIDLVRSDSAERRRELWPALLGLDDRLREIIIGQHVAGRHRQKVVQLFAPFEMPVDRRVSQPDERSFGDVPSHVGMTVAIAAHPRSESKEPRQLEFMIGKLTSECLSQREVNRRDNLPQPRHDRQPPFDFLQNTRPHRSQEFGLPKNSQVGSQASHHGGSFARQEVGAIEILQALPHAPQFRPNRTPLGFARMSGEDQFDVELFQCLLNLLGVQTGGFQLLDRRSDRFADRSGMLFLLALPQHANSLPVLGEIRQIEEDAQRPSD